MKKLFLVLAIAGFAVACNNSDTKTEEKTDTATMTSPDTTAKMPDTTSMMSTDTTKKTDTTK